MEQRALASNRWGFLREPRWQLVVALAALAVLLAGVTAVVSRDEDADRPTTRVASPSTSLAPTSTTTSGATTAPATPTTTVASTTSTPATSPPTTARAPATTATPRATTATTVARACRNSSNPACGPLVWDPMPAANQPMTLTIDYGLTPTRVGQTVTFRLFADDPDAEVSSCVSAQYGDGSPGTSCARRACPPQYGTWTPVARRGHLERTFQHTYSRPGTYVASFGVSSISCGASLIFGNEGSIEANVVVRP